MIMASKVALYLVVIICCQEHQANGGIVALLSGAVQSVFGGGDDRFANSTNDRNKTDRSKLEK